MFPQVRQELTYWRTRALAIPDPELRRHALATHHGKGKHSEGAAAFAVLAPACERRAVVKGLIAFQAMYDYLDTLSEQPGGDPLTNGWQLHSALIAALDRKEPYGDYYALHPQSDDGGYLRSFIVACREACAAIPSFEIVAPAVRTAAVRAMESQGYHHALTLRSPPLPTTEVECWAMAQRPARRGFFWWEILGAAGSSLAILALMAAAGRPHLRPVDCEAIETLYFPWAGALLGLMDSLVDQAGDEQGGQHSLTSRYRTRSQAADRLRLIASRSLELTCQVPDGRRHALIIAAMTSFFATEAGASLPDAQAGAGAALAALGAEATLSMAALRMRRRVERVRLSVRQAA